MIERVVSLDERYVTLRDRADRTLRDQKVADAMVKVRAIIGAGGIPASETLAQAALDKLRKGEVPLFNELAALEIVVRMMRPVVFSQDGELDELPEAPNRDLHPPELKDHWNDFRARIKPFLQSIGRIETKMGRHIGTGFLVASRLLATNRHVLNVLTFGTDVLPVGEARIVFKQELGRTNVASDIVAIEGVAAIHPKLDMVLLSLAGGDRPPLVLSSTSAAQGSPVVAIGYPGDDPTNNPLFLSGVFGGKFGVKRAALGEVLKGTDGSALFHDCSTTQGNSGSPVLSLSNGEVAGLHRSGYFMYRNEAVDVTELRAFVASA